MNTGGFSIPNGHQVFKGHFPDLPVVPGSMVLDHVLALWAKPYHSIAKVKFLRPLGPDTQVDVLFETLSSGAVGFVCHSAAGPICSGRIEPVPNTAPPAL